MQDILYLYDATGTLCGVQLSPALWERAKSHIRNIQASQPVAETPEPLDAWEEFKQYWDFKYPFCANVECLNCGARCDDWEHDPARRFRLRTANLGGLLVFRCACGASIRKKHFKDHMVFEMTPPGCGCEMLPTR
ncbi:MAG: hypothetical protein FWH34_03830 [Desulfovibrionaceae bacterium]|nr:hypothetical protein [Desulfovibrionaceae bacterium]